MLRCCSECCGRFCGNSEENSGILVDMSAGTLVSLEEYLNTSYDPDVEYVDGVLEERNVGDSLHSLIQRNLIVALSRKYPHLYALPELRSRTRSTRYRIPDVCVLLAFPKTSFCSMPHSLPSRFSPKTTRCRK